MDELSARAVLVPASDVGDGLTTAVSRSEIEDALGAEEAPIALVLDVTRFAEGEAGDTRTVAVSWERDDLERILREAEGEEVILTFDRDRLREAVEGDVEAHGMREAVLALAVAATAATGAAATAAAEPGPFLGANASIAQSLGPDDRAVSRAAPTPAPQLASDDRAVSRATPTPAPQLSPDDRAVPRTTPTPAPQLSPDDRAAPRATPIEAPAPSVSPDDRAVPRTTPTPAPQLSPDDRAAPRATPIEAPAPSVSPDDRSVPRATPVEATGPSLSPDDRAVPRSTPIEAPATGTVSDPGISWAPSPAETAVLAGMIALAITGGFFIVGGRRVRPRPT